MSAAFFLIDWFSDFSSMFYQYRFYLIPIFSTFNFKILLNCVDDVTVAICPGIGNTSETVYIRTFVHLAQSMGYRCAVLNHIGALPSVEVTSSRIFSYGKWLNQMQLNIDKTLYTQRRCRYIFCTDKKLFIAWLTMSIVVCVVARER